MARTRKRQQKKNTLEKLQKLRACTVVLRNIALDADLIQRYRINLPLKQEKLLEQSHINTSTHSKKRSKGSVEQKKNATKNRKHTVKNVSKNKITERKRKDNKKNEPWQIYKVIKVDKDVSSHQDNEEISKFILKKQLTHNNDVEPVSNKSTDETSSTASVTHFNYMQKMTVLMNKIDKTVRKPSIKNRIDAEKIQYLNKPVITNDTDVKPAKLESNDKDCLDKKNLTVNNQISKTQEISSKSILYTQWKNLYPINFSDGIRCKVKQERCKMNKNNKDIIVQTPTCHAEVSPENNIKMSKVEIRQNLPKIIGNCVLSKGIKVLKGAKKEIKVDKLRVNNGLRSSCEQISLEQEDKWNNNNKNTNETFHINDTADNETTNIPRENHTSLEINGSINILKSTSPLNNNVDLKDKSISDNNFHSKFIDYKNLNSWTRERENGHIDVNVTDNETTMTHKNHTSNHQEQLSRFTNNIDIHENNALQDNKKCEERCTNNILNKNQHTQEISNLIDDENCSKLLISTSKEGDRKQTQKRTLEEKDKNSDLSSKKIKLNRDTWQQSNETCKSINHKQFNDSLNSEASIMDAMDTTDTITELNISEEHNHQKRTDLRQHLDQIRLGKTLNATVETKNEEVYKKPFVKEESSTLNKSLCEKKSAQEQDKSVVSDNEDDDCISLYFNESLVDFDITRGEDKFVSERDKSCHSLHFDVPYEMTANSFDKFMKQNNNEFDKDYEEYIENEKIKTEPLTFNKSNEVFNNQLTQTITTDCKPATATEPNSLQIRNACSINENLMGYIKNYCFSALRNRKCTRTPCIYIHNLRNLFDKINSKETQTIIDIIQEALSQNFNYFCEVIYISLLKKLNVEQILETYNMLYGPSSSYFKKEFPNIMRINIACSIIEELLKRYMPMKVIFERMMTYILPTKNISELYNIIICIQKFMKHDEYWNSIRNFILNSDSNVRKYIIDEMIHECIMSKNLRNIQDVNNNLISQLESTVISTLDKYGLIWFRNMLSEKPAENSCPKVSIPNFGERSTSDTIASPDSPDRSPNANFIQQESSTKYDNSVSETDSNQSETQSQNTQAENVKPYIYGFLQPINVPNPQCTYKNHERFWKFFVDLDRFEKGVMYEDYDYIISVLKIYDTKKRERELFVSKCSVILRKIERSEYHFKNILRRTGNQYFNNNTLKEWDDRGYVP